MRDHHRLAQLLKITDRPGGHNSTLLTKSEEAELDRFASKNMDELPKAQLNIFWARMAASYLPQLVRTQIEYPFNVPSSSKNIERMNYDFNVWMESLLSALPVNRFVRERPAEAIALERNLVERISRISPDDLARTVWKQGNHDSTLAFPILHLTLASWRLIVEHLENYLPLSARHLLALPSKQTRRRLKRLLPVLERVNDHPNRATTAMARFLRSYRLVWNVEGEREMGVVELRARRDEGARWWACEGALEWYKDGSDDPDEGGEKSGCTAWVKEGEEMKACSRCGAVRYCSEAHQTAHWPTHRLVCVRPRW